MPNSLAPRPVLGVVASLVFALPAALSAQSDSAQLTLDRIFASPEFLAESFGPARAMATQRRQGHDVYLLTLTRGEATNVRHKFGWTLEQMGAARHREMQDVKATLELADMRVLNLPDGKLKELDPWRVEEVIREEILRVKPHVVNRPTQGVRCFSRGCHHIGTV